MSVPLNTVDPLSLSQWVAFQNTTINGTSEFLYSEYLKSWYRNQANVKTEKKHSLREEYVQLLKDLNFLFGDVQGDPFLADIDYNNEEDLILAIPYFARKLKEVSQVLCSKREAVKKVKTKYNLAGSNLGLETILYDYILRNFTQRDGYVVQIPAFALQESFPELATVKDSFFVDIEELHDPVTYHDTDPDESNDLNLDEIMNDTTPLSKPITRDMVFKIISNKILPRLAQTTLSKLFSDYLTTVATVTDSTEITQQTDNLLGASQKYLGERVYALTAVKTQDLLLPDYLLDLNIITGNNWFLWPNGYQVLAENIYNNTYEPVGLQDSNLINSGATAGTNSKDSDIIYTDKNGIVEGAWLRGNYTEARKGQVEIILENGEISEFLFPYVGFELSPETLKFGTHTLTERNVKLFKTLTPALQESVLTSYYTQSTPLTASLPVYLNQTNLIDSGAYAAEFSDVADSIKRNAHDFTLPLNYTGIVENAYLYKFQKTDLIINSGTQNILWPLMTYGESYNLPITLNEEFCLPVRLADLNNAYCFDGAIAGTSIDSADIIYKTSSPGDINSATEIAWLQSSPISDLKIDNDIPIYKNKAIDCAHFIEGPIQDSLALSVESGERMSFIWCGPDTLADDVFKYVEHTDACEYGKNYPHDYYKDQDYINPSPLYNKNYWTTCSCKSVYYSPIGHRGNKFLDYNSVTDYLYADPKDLGDDFTLDNWKDTRLFNYKNSPQFAYFKLNNDNSPSDGEVGFGRGRWKTGDDTTSVGDKMVLKTGRRYTYYRSNLKIGPSSGVTTDGGAGPAIVTKHSYKSIPGEVKDDSNYYDIAIVVDVSRSLSYDLQDIKDAVSEMCLQLTKNKEKKTQIAIIAVAQTSVYINYLTSDAYTIALTFRGYEPVNTWPSYTTDLKTGLELANYLLNTQLPTAQGTTTASVVGICNNLNKTISNFSAITTALNTPNAAATKKIIIISDGAITADDTKVSAATKLSKLLSYADALKTSKTPIEITSVNIGELSVTNDVMEQLATSGSTYFDLYKYLVSGDGDYKSFVSYVSRQISGNIPLQPMWKRALKNNGVVTATDEISPMVLKPNDFLTYHHKSGVVYNDMVTKAFFTQTTPPFTINIKLDGWNYNTNSFSVLNVGLDSGAKPFWAEVPSDPSPVAGVIRFVNNYIPIHQPDVSTMVLRNSDFVSYTRATGANVNLVWKQPLKMLETVQTNTWNKINFKRTYSNLADFLKTNNRDIIVEYSFEPSDMTLEGYSEYKPVRYHYISQSDFNYTENLYLRNKCVNSYLTLTSGIVIDPPEPHTNLINRYYPTVPTISFPHLAVTEKQVGGYMLPENLGVSTYRGRGVEYEIDTNVLSLMDAASAERLFLDPTKYGNRNRGLTRKDQLAPTSLKNTDNSWVVEPYSTGSKAGTPTDVKENQKFTPYQTSYEMLGYNKNGLARQDDDFEFWNFNKGVAEWDAKNNEINYRKEVNEDAYAERVGKLLVNKGSLVNWRTDIFGNDYGLYKHVETISSDDKFYAYKVAPSITSFTNSKTSNSVFSVKVKEKIVFTIKVNGSKPFSYQWYRNGVPIPAGSGSTFTIKKANYTHVGVYSCKVSNVAGYAVSGTFEIIGVDY